MKRIILLAMVFTSLFCYSQNFDSLKILILDFDGDNTFTNPDNSQQQIGYEYNFVKAFNSLGFTEGLNFILAKKIPETFNEIKDYAAIFLITGHRPFGYMDLTYGNIADFSTYLDSGGCMYIEGNNVPSELYDIDSLFMFNYFNNSCTNDGGTGFSGIDTIVSDTTDTLDPFFRYYRFVYPANTKPDSSVDVIGPKFSGLLKANYRNLLQYDDQTKLYKSVSSSYTPPETKVFFFPGKTIMQSVDFGAFAATASRTDMDDSLENQLIRASYLRDMLKYFGIGKTLLVKDDKEQSGSDSRIINSLNGLHVEFDEISVKSGGDGPNYKTLIQYATVIWYTGDEDSVTTLTNTDTTNLGKYLDFGGNIILSGENMAKDLGVADTSHFLSENPFLARRLRVDYIRNPVADPRMFFANQDGEFYDNLGSRACSLTTSGTPAKPDILNPYPFGDHVDSVFYFSTTKATSVVAIANEGLLRKTIFFGLPIEDLYQTDIDSVLEVSFVDYFDMDLNFEPRKWDDFTSNSKKDANHFSKKTIIDAPAVFCSGRIIFIDGLTNSRLIDVSGREILKLNDGFNDLKSVIKSGIYFIKGKYNNTIYVKALLIL